LTIIWYFSLDTMAQKDIPSQLKLVGLMKQEKLDTFLYWILDGCDCGFHVRLEYPEESQKLIQGLVALAPVVYLNGIPKIELVKPLIFVGHRK
jgi:hypothetical protein